MNQLDNLYTLKRLYVFTGELQLITALHLGGGDLLLGSSDSPVVRSVDGSPYIPGSSIKGAFRATVEKLAATLGLPNMDRDVLDTQNEYLRTFTRRRRGELDDAGNEVHHAPWTEAETIQHIEDEWPATALLFGTPYTAGRILFQDAVPLVADEAVIQRRDGVAIDRDSERAVDHLKYDYEVVAPTLSLRFTVTLRDPEDRDLQLTCMGLSEMASDFFSLGGKRSSGLGRCRLQNLQIYELDLTTDDDTARIARLQRYLLHTSLENKLTLVARNDEAPRWLQGHIATLMNAVGGKHA